MHPAIEDFLERKRAVQGLRPRTIKNYKNNLDLFMRHVNHKALIRIGEKDIISFLGRFDNIATKTNRFATLKLFFEWLYDTGLIPSDPTRNLDKVRPKIKAMERIDRSMLLTNSELRRMFEACVTLEERMILRMLYSSGIRARELTNLKIENIDLKARRGYLPERKRKRQGGPFRFDSKTTTHLQHYIAWKRRSRGLLLGFSYYKLRLMLLKIAKRAGITQKRIHPHLFRHMWATKMNEMGVDLHTQQILGGWEGPRMPMRYAHPSVKKEKHEYDKAFK